MSFADTRIAAGRNFECRKLGCSHRAISRRYACSYDDRGRRPTQSLTTWSNAGALEFFQSIAKLLTMADFSQELHIPDKNVGMRTLFREQDASVSEHFT
jgi:hypothetical protein